MLNRRSTKIKRAKNLSEQKQDDLQNLRTSPKVKQLDIYLCIHICICICKTYIRIHIYLYYIYICAYTGTTHRVRQVRQPPYQNFFIVSSVLVRVEKNFTFCTFEWIINWKFQAKRLIHKGLFMIIVLFVSLA